MFFLQANTNWNSYLEIQDDGPYQAEYDGRPAVDQVSGVYVHQLNPLPGQESECGIRVWEEVGASEDSAALHRLKRKYKF